jgi:DNA-binding NarL/FixJ family response regulator
VADSANFLEPWFVRFHDLMPFRVREILLVSSDYDFFTLEEDGPLVERLFLQYSELNLSSAPRITHATTCERALELLAQRRFDLVLGAVRWGSAAGADPGRAVKRVHPQLPVVQLAFDEVEVSGRGGGGGVSRPGGYDRAFLWTGDARVLLAVIKLVEDAANVDPDTRSAGVQVILLVEDSVRRYSNFLAILYAELMKQSQSLIAEGLNDLHRLLRMRARPKILLATSYEEAVACHERFAGRLLAVITDMRLPCAGREDPEAGLDLVKLVRRANPDAPVLLQSAEPDSAERARDLEVSHMDKGSPDIARRLREFLLEYLGFGDFVFRLPDRTEVFRARDMYEMQRVLRLVPAESLEYHASRHHFSVWLRARCMFRLADHLKRYTVGDFAGIEEVRAYLLSALEQAAMAEQLGVVAEFSSVMSDRRKLFSRVGSGSLGGKGRSIAFTHTLLASRSFAPRAAGLEVRIPRTVVIGTDAFDRFLEQNGLPDAALWNADDGEIVARFLAGVLPEPVRRDLAAAMATFPGPIAVRSSSLLEDSRRQSCAGIYTTYMLPNNHPDPAVRLTELAQAVRAVYASTFCRPARTYRAGSPYTVADEKMAVVIQEIVGRRYGDRFYPHFSGVALSHNHYPIGPQRATEGIALVALGLGHAVMHGERTLRFSPARPQVSTPVTSARSLLAHSQRRFYALDMARPVLDFEHGPESSLAVCDLAAAEEDGTLALVGSVYVQEDDVVCENLTWPGPRVVTFNNVLKWSTIPLAAALQELLEAVAGGMGCPVEIEFAVDAAGGARAAGERRRPGLYVLQARPLAHELPPEGIPVGDPTAPGVLVASSRSLGHGAIEDVRDVVYVRTGRPDPASAVPLVAQIADLDRRLASQSRPYILVGPGRWGSADTTLGIPVEWFQIASARLIVETAVEGDSIEPSQGSHFLHNLTAHRTGYVCVERSRRPAPGAAGTPDFVDLDWLDRTPAAWESPLLRHVHLERPLSVWLDGRAGRAVVVDPAASEATVGGQ